MTAFENENQALADFIAHSPSPYHAVDTLAGTLLRKNGYLPLHESEEWHLIPGGKYYVTRNGTTLAAFRIPRSPAPCGFMITAAHSDAPSYKVKENPELSSGAYVRLATEPYGGMICATWLDRPLSIAGRVLVKTEKGIMSRLLHIDRDLLLIPNVAIHMNRSVNTGFNYNANVDMIPLYGEGSAKGSFKSLLAKELHVEEDQIIGSDLFLYNRQAASVWGAENEFFSAPRLDDLQCAFATVRGFIDAEEGSAIPICTVFDNEEVGSATKQGAGSTFLYDLLLRITESLGMSGSTLRRMIASSMMISADNAHALHPNHPEYADATHRPLMNKGIVIKYNAAQRYTTDAVSASLFESICRQSGVPTQTFTNRADLAGGSTLGSISNTRVSMITVDIGLPQLAMHSTYETAGTKDTAYLISACRTFFSSSLTQTCDGTFTLQIPKKEDKPE